MSDRMLSDEILLGIINSKSGGGGGGGTGNYNDLSNQPQINNNTLVGNKTASDLGLVAAETGKGLSSNNYTDEDKAIVGGVTAALAGKQGSLTAGNNIKLDNDTISVNRWAVPAGKVVYTVITSDENYGQSVHVQRHTTSGGFIDDRVYLVQSWQTKTVDDVISIEDQYAKYKITLLKDSDEQSAGYYYMVNPTTTPTSNSFTFTMPQEENDNDLIIREELNAVSDAVDAIKDGTNIDSFADVESALANKQDKTDNNLETTSKTVVGAVNELKSGLTNVQDDFTDVIGWDERKNLVFKMIGGTTVNESGEIVTNAIYNLFVAKVVSGVTYTATKGGDYEVYAFYANEPVIGSVSYNNSRTSTASQENTYSFTSPINGYVVFRGLAAFTNAQLEKGSTATPYEPYHPVIGDALTELDVALSVPDGSGKNVLPLTLASLKEINSNGTWASNVYTKNSRTFTVSTNSSGYVTSIVVNGTDDAEQDTTFILASVTELNNMLDGAYILNGCPSGGNTNYRIYIGSDVIDDGGGVSFNTPLTGTYSGIRVKSDYTANNLTFYPMIRLASETDPTFAPYIPSVDARLDAVESGLIKITKESYENITVNAGSKKWVANVGLLPDNVVITAYSNVSDVIAYVAKATTTYQIYLYNPTNADITNNVTVMIAKV